MLPDIDLDFPRALRDELIERVHERFGPEYAVLAGAIATYKIKGVLRDLGKALGLPQEELGLLSKQMRSHDAGRSAGGDGAAAGVQPAGECVRVAGADRAGAAADGGAEAAEPARWAG